jgi:hypothetical protein
MSGSMTKDAWILFCLSVTLQYYKFSSYLTGNILRLYYKVQPVNAVYCENHTEHIKTLCGQNVKAGGIYIYHCLGSVVGIVTGYGLDD